MTEGSPAAAKDQEIFDLCKKKQKTLKPKPNFFLFCFL